MGLKLGISSLNFKGSLESKAMPYTVISCIAVIAVVIFSFWTTKDPWNFLGLLFVSSVLNIGESYTSLYCPSCKQKNIVQNEYDFAGLPKVLIVNVLIITGTAVAVYFSETGWVLLIMVFLVSLDPNPEIISCRHCNNEFQRSEAYEPEEKDDE